MESVIKSVETEEQLMICVMMETILMEMDARVYALLNKTGNVQILHAL